MGGSTSRLEKALGTSFPEDEKYFGFENFGNTCYCNSVMQALYFCEPFRQHVYRFRDESQGKPAAPSHISNILPELAELFDEIRKQRKKSGHVAPKRFVARIQHENELFRPFQHQDAHEFLNFVLNAVNERLEFYAKQEKEVREAERRVKDEREGSGGGSKKSKKRKDKERREEQAPAPFKSWVHDIFEGTLTNETKCLECETVTNRDESFLDLSVDVEQNSSVSACLRNFSSTETLGRQDKFYCDHCCSLQEAQKRMMVKKLPNVLVVHLKRFKYFEHLHMHKKLSHRVVFPFELKLPNTSRGATDPERLYDLFAVVIHLGSGPNHGHYVAIVKSHGYWMYCDDESIELIDEDAIPSVFGSTAEQAGNERVGYLLFYQARHLTVSLQQAYQERVAAKSSGKESSGSLASAKTGSKTPPSARAAVTLL